MRYVYSVSLQYFTNEKNKTQSGSPSPKEALKVSKVPLAVLHEGQESQTVVLTYVTDSAYSAALFWTEEGTIN